MFSRRLTHFTLLILMSGVLFAGCGNDLESGEANTSPTSGGNAVSSSTNSGGNAATSAPPSAKKTGGSERPAGNFQGNVEAANCESVVGWVWDPSQPNSPIRIDIYDGETKLATVTAESLRQDLVKAGIGNGAHGFLYPIPASLRDGKPHSIWVGIAGTDSNINKPNPKTITCPAK